MKTQAFKIFSFLLAGLSPVISYTQTNLVVNPSLEQYTQCPDNYDQINYAIGWNLFRISPDYFNACSFNPDFSVPNNLGGYQMASSGFSYGAIITFLGGTYLFPDAREFAGGSLTSPLTIGTKYFVSFKVSPSFSSVNDCNCAVNNLGANFSTVSNDSFPITNTAKVNAANIITDTTNWTQIFGSFIADSAYQYIVIGNFFDDNNTDTLIMDTSALCKFAYYYFDDVCVSTDSAYAFNYVGINDELNDDIVEIFSNPIIDLLNIVNKSSLSLDFIISDNIGRNILQDHLAPYSKNSFDFNSFNSGVYFIYFFINHNCITKKLIKL